MVPWVFRCVQPSLSNSYISAHLFPTPTPFLNLPDHYHRHHHQSSNPPPSLHSSSSTPKYLISTTPPQHPTQPHPTPPPDKTQTLHCTYPSSAGVMPYTSLPYKCQYHAADPIATAVAAVPAAVKRAGEEEEASPATVDALYTNHPVSSAQLFVQSQLWEARGVCWGGWGQLHTLTPCLQTCVLAAANTDAFAVAANIILFNSI